MSIETDIVEVIGKLGPWAIVSGTGLVGLRWFRQPIERRIRESPFKGKFGDKEFSFDIAPQLAQQQAQLGKDAGSPSSPAPTDVVPPGGLAIAAEAASTIQSSLAVKTLAAREREQRDMSWRLSMGWRYERIWRVITRPQFDVLRRLSEIESITDSEAQKFYETLPPEIRSTFTYPNFVGYLVDMGLVSNIIVGGSTTIRITSEGRLFLRFVDDASRGIWWPTLAPNNPWTPPDDAYAV